MILLTLLTLLGLALVIAFPFAIYQLIYQAATDTKIEQVVLLEIVNRKASFKVYYNDGKASKVEVVKFGSPRYNKLRGMCE